MRLFCLVLNLLFNGCLASEARQAVGAHSSKTRDLLLDPFGGSGTTAIACEKSGRRARLIEMDPKYCDVIVRRWQEFTGQDATCLSDSAKFGALSEIGQSVTS